MKTGPRAGKPTFAPLTDHWLVRILLMVIWGLGSTGIALATPDIEIWLGERTGRFGDYEFAVLGGRPDYPTPTGAFVVQWKSRSWWSRQWNAAMPYAVFFRGGAAIHEGSLSVPSHGCIHVSQKAARYVFDNCKEGVTRVFVYP